jgi:hypothetical protein
MLVVQQLQLLLDRTRSGWHNCIPTASSLLGQLVLDV